MQYCCLLCACWAVPVTLWLFSNCMLATKAVCVPPRIAHLPIPRNIIAQQHLPSILSHCHLPALSTLDASTQWPIILIKLHVAIPVVRIVVAVLMMLVRTHIEDLVNGVLVEPQSSFRIHNAVVTVGACALCLIHVAQGVTLVLLLVFF